MSKSSRQGFRCADTIGRSNGILLLLIRTKGGLRHLGDVRIAAFAANGVGNYRNVARGRAIVRGTSRVRSHR